MQMRVLLTPIREVAECASIPHLPECYAGSTQWFPPLHRPTGNYREPERERARGIRVSGRCAGPPVLFSCHLWETQGWFACWVKCKCRLLPHPFLQNTHRHTPAHTVTGNYSMRVVVLDVRLGGQACCLLPVGRRASPLRLHPQSAPLAPCLPVLPPVVCFFPTCQLNALCSSRFLSDNSAFYVLFEQQCEVATT